MEIILDKKLRCMLGFPWACDGFSWACIGINTDIRMAYWWNSHGLPGSLSASLQMSAGGVPRTPVAPSGCMELYCDSTEMNIGIHAGIHIGLLLSFYSTTSWMHMRIIIDYMLRLLLSLEWDYAGITLGLYGYTYSDSTGLLLHY